MEVYYQRTESNERLCSLLSSVLGRSIQPRFDRAKIEKQQLLASTNALSGSTTKREGTIEIVLVGTNQHREDFEFFAAWIPKFARRFELQVSWINTSDIGYNSGNPHQKKPKYFSFGQALDEVILGQKNRNDPHHIVLVGLEQSSITSIYNYLWYESQSSKRSQNKDKVVGVISIHPTELPFFWTVPLFVVLQPSLLLSGELRKCLTNPELFTVISPYVRETSTTTTAISLRMGEPGNALWMIRLMAKYAEAAVMVYKTNPSSLVSRSRL